MRSKKQVRGRPAKGDEKRVHVSVYLEPDLAEVMQSMADRDCRRLSQQINYVLRQVVIEDKMGRSVVV